MHSGLCLCKQLTAGAGDTFLRLGAVRGHTLPEAGTGIKVPGLPNSLNYPEETFPLLTSISLIIGQDQNLLKKVTRVQ